MIGWEFPPFKIGGLGTHCYELTRALAKKGVKIDFFMPKTKYKIDAPWMRIVAVSPEVVLKMKGAVYKRKKSRNIFDAIEEYNENAALVLEEMNKKENYSLIHCHDWITARAGMRAKYLTSLPLVVTTHSTEFDRSANLNPSSWIWGIEKAVFDQSKRIIAVSNFVKKTIMEKYSIDGKKIAVIPNAVSKNNFKYKATKEQFGWDNKKIVLFVGRLEIQKGPDFFLRAAKKVIEKRKDILFVISGEGSMLPQLINLSIDLGIQNNVRFLGVLPQEKLSQLYSVADVYVLPSVREPFGITVLEAMIAGTPVITSKTAGAPEIATHCLRVDFWDTNEMANKILAVVEYGALRKEMSKNAYQNVENITWDKVAEKTIGIYNEVRK